MFGPGIPILFLLGLIALLTNSAVEKIALTRLYRKPPLYSKHILYSFRHWILISPLFYALNGYWMFSNGQIFDNKWVPVTTTYE